MTNLLRYIYLKTPSLSEMPYIATVTQAQQQMIARTQLEMTTVPNYHRTPFDHFVELTKEKFTSKFEKKFTVRTWQLTIMMGVISFMISTLLLCAGGYLRNRYRKQHLLSQLIIGKKEIQFKPVIVVSEGDMHLIRVQT